MFPKGIMSITTALFLCLPQLSLGAAPPPLTELQKLTNDLDNDNYILREEAEKKLKSYKATAGEYFIRQMMFKKMPLSVEQKVRIERIIFTSMTSQSISPQLLYEIAITEINTQVTKDQSFLKKLHKKSEDVLGTLSKSRQRMFMHKIYSWLKNSQTSILKLERNLKLFKNLALPTDLESYRNELMLKKNLLDMHLFHLRDVYIPALKEQNFSVTAYINQTDPFIRIWRQPTSVDYIEMRILPEGLFFDSTYVSSLYFPPYLSRKTILPNGKKIEHYGIDGVLEKFGISLFWKFETDELQVKFAYPSNGRWQHVDSIEEAVLKVLGNKFPKIFDKIPLRSNFIENPIFKKIKIETLL